MAYDLDHNHVLDKLELTEAMAAMGHRPSPQEVDELMIKVETKSGLNLDAQTLNPTPESKVDKDGSGTVELDEFEHMVRASLSRPVSISLALSLPTPPPFLFPASLSFSHNRCLSLSPFPSLPSSSPASLYVSFCLSPPLLSLPLSPFFADNLLITQPA